MRMNKLCLILCVGTSIGLCSSTLEISSPLANEFLNVDNEIVCKKKKKREVNKIKKRFDSRPISTLSNRIFFNQLKLYLFYQASLPFISSKFGQQQTTPHNTASWKLFRFTFDKNNVHSNSTNMDLFKFIMIKNNNFSFLNENSHKYDIYK